jgi:hypothetical protein
LADIPKRADSGDITRIHVISGEIWQACSCIGAFIYAQCLFGQ